MDNIVCEKCGHDVPDGVLVCGYCGRAVPREQLSDSTVQQIKANERTDESLKTDTAAGVRSIGFVLMTIGIACDLISAAVIGFGSLDLSLFTALSVGGTACFAIGLFLAFANRG